MVTVGVRELKQQLSRLLRLVRDEGEMVEITYRGEAVARLVPVDPPAPAPEEMEAILADLEQLAVEVSARWPEGVSALDAVDDVRREL